jgi:hypothetical protein
MSIIKIYVIWGALFCSLVTKAQTTPNYRDFSNFVGRGFKLPENLKLNCEWMYAVVKVDINTEHTITKYKVISQLPDTMKCNFDFLVGYKFQEKMKPGSSSLAFYFSIDNSEICKPIEGQKIFYSPNQVVGIIYGIFQRLRSDDPKTIIEPYPIIKKFYAPQQ